MSVHHGVSVHPKLPRTRCRVWGPGPVDGCQLLNGIRLLTLYLTASPRRTFGQLKLHSDSMSDIREVSFWRNLLEKLLKIVLKGSSKKKPSQRHQHVVPHEKGWAVRGEGNTRVTSTYKYQDDAIDRATGIAKRYGADVVIHGKDGKIRDRRNYD